MQRDATIIERGNGIPDVGALVQGNDGNLYRIITSTGHLQTGRPGEGCQMAVTVEEVDWDDEVKSIYDIYPCDCIL